MLDEDVAIIRSFDKACNIDNNIFSSEVIGKSYGDTLVDVVT